MEFNFNMEELKAKAKALGQSGLNMAQTGVDKSIQMAAIAKLKAANVKVESDLRAAYTELGKMYFAEHGEDPEELFAASCAQIADLHASIAATNAKIAEIKIAPDVAVEVEVEEVEVEETDAPAEEAPAEEAPAEEAPAEETPAEESSDESDDYAPIG